MVAVPALVPAVNVAEQLPEARVHVVELNDPAAPVLLNVTVPVGVIAVPTSLSVTVAVHVVEELVLMDDGLHTTAVRVLRLFTATVVLPALVEWLLSPP